MDGAHLGGIKGALGRVRAGEEDPARERVQVFEPDGWPDRIRQYYDQHTAA